MKKYIRIMRIDHWIKNLFILPGVGFAFLLCGTVHVNSLITPILLGFVSTCIIASANYVINEWLDADFDRFHPLKKHRAVVEESVNKVIVYCMYIMLTIVGLIIGYSCSFYVFLMELWLWIMGIIYNVKPFRTKDIAIVDVLSESVNNAIRLLIGWFIVTSDFLPPVSIVLGYWMGGAFLMDVKRFSEYMMIDDKETASLYRKSFRYYDERLLLCASFFYGIMSSLFVGIFLIKYRVEFILISPVLTGLFCYYLYISFKNDSAAQAPEKLYREKGLMIYVLALIILFALLLKIDIVPLQTLLNNQLIGI